MAKENTINNNLNLVCTGTELVGDIKSGGDIRVDGVIKGNLKIAGRAVIGSTAHIEGDIEAVEIDVMGEIKGNLNASNMVTIRNKGKLEGNIVTKAISIEMGASFNGNCNMINN